MGYITVSARIKREIWEALKRHNVNISKVIQEALSRKAYELETEWAVETMRRISSKASLEEPTEKVIRRDRDSR